VSSVCGGVCLQMFFLRPWLLLTVLASTAPAEDLSFNRDIRPVLSDNCFFCHGPDKNNRKGDLRLDVREELIKLGPQTLIERINTADADDLMPPNPLRPRAFGGKGAEGMKKEIPSNKRL
jgi:mono/diheme cytochrome c family protein